METERVGTNFFVAHCLPYITTQLQRIKLQLWSSARVSDFDHFFLRFLHSSGWTKQCYKKACLVGWRNGQAVAFQFKISREITVWNVCLHFLSLRFGANTVMSNLVKRKRSIKVSSFFKFNFQNFSWKCDVKSLFSYLSLNLNLARNWIRDVKMLFYGIRIIILKF